MRKSLHAAVLIAEVDHLRCNVHQVHIRYQSIKQLAVDVLLGSAMPRLAYLLSLAQHRQELLALHEVPVH